MAATILRHAPYFPVPDVAQAVAEYENVFGFAAEYVAGEPPEFAFVARDGKPIMLRRVDRSHRLVPNEAQGGTWDVFFWVTDARGLYAEFESRGATTVYPPKETHYGTVEFAVRDRNGYVLGFGQELASGGTAVGR